MKMKSTYAFPWRIYQRIFFIQVSLVAFALGASGFVARYLFKKELLHRIPSGQFLGHLDETMRVLDTSLGIFLGVTAIGFALLAAWSGRILVIPIARILQRANLGTGRESMFESAELGTQTYGELSDLEVSIEDMRRDLEAKSESLRTEREELTTLMGAISDAILAVDQNESVLFFNSRFIFIFENERSEELKRRRRLREMFRDPDVIEAYQNALKEGKSSSVQTVPFDSEAGKRYYSVSVAPLRKAAEGAVYGAVGVFHDVTNLKRAEQIRIEFVANVSHELRTPLTAIKGYADTLNQDMIDGRPIEKEFVDVIVRNTERLMNLINDLLNLSSLESTDGLQKSPINTDEITQRVIRNMQGAFQKKTQQVKVSIQAPSVKADFVRLEQVLVNLLDNANKYSPAGSIIELLWEQTPEEIVLKVKDVGPGIPVEHHARLFERFYRVDKARSREMGGTGLGLAIVKHIMQRHGGGISVESTLGHGATFICKFPV